MKKQKIIIIDYTLGNLFSVQRALHNVGANVKISDNKNDIYDADKIVLPGVGAFSAGIKGLQEKNLSETIIKVVNDGKPILGICLGMQMLMTKSEENGLHKGLNLIKGKVSEFESPTTNDSFKIPHYGWSKVNVPKGANSNSWDKTLLNGFSKKNLFCYFVHSFFVKTNNSAHTIGETIYGKNLYASVISNKNITGCQFHPEKSGQDGLRIINNFVQMKD